MSRLQDHSSPSMSSSISFSNVIPPTLFFGFVVFRLCNSFLTRTFFQPDEYWQSLEPAHNLVYGYGYLTWEWREGLRSAAHPLIFAAFYWLASNVFGVSSPDAIVWVPKIVQAVIAAIGDFYFCVLAVRLYGKDHTKDVLWWAGFITVGSAFNFYVSIRTFSNSLEMVLTTVGLAYWPWNPKLINWKQYILALLIASASCVFRPTNALIWLFLGLLLLVRSPNRVKAVFLALAVVGAVFSINFGIDYLYYGRPVFPIIKFLEFNLLQSLSHFYGTSPWHYYLFQGIPLLLIGYLPFTVIELTRSGFRSQITNLILFIVVVYSSLRHKEFRFLYPILPLLHLKTLSAFLYPLPQLAKYATKTVFFSLYVLNIIVAVFFNTYHQRGVIDVMEYLRNNDHVKSVGFLMPCHSTPWQSHLHRPDLEQPNALWFLTCEPPINMSKEEREAYLDVSDQFYENPTEFMSVHFPPLNSTDEDQSEKTYTYTWPSHLVFFEALEPTIKSYLKSTKYYEVSQGLLFFFPSFDLLT